MCSVSSVYGIFVCLVMFYLYANIIQISCITLAGWRPYTMCMDFSCSDILDGRGTIFIGRVIYRKCFLLFCSLCGALLPNVAQQENINMMKKMTKERGLYKWYKYDGIYLITHPAHDIRYHDVSSSCSWTQTGNWTKQNETNRSKICFIFGIYKSGNRLNYSTALQALDQHHLSDCVSGVR